MAECVGAMFQERAVEPVAVTAREDLLQLHRCAGIELRLVPSLWPVHDLAVSEAWDFSMVRMRNAQPRTSQDVGPEG